MDHLAQGSRRNFSLISRYLDYRTPIAITLKLFVWITKNPDLLKHVYMLLFPILTHSLNQIKYSV